MSELHLLNAGAWTMHFFQCANATVDGVTIRSRGLANNDGIDVDSSTRIEIRNCDIDTGDDAICLKTTSTMACTHIRVSDCTLNSMCAAFKIGTESLGDFSDIWIGHCHVKEAKLGAIKLLSVDGAHIRGITVENITVESADTPIFMRLGARLKVFRASDQPRSVGSFSQVLVRNVKVARVLRVGCLLSGVPGSPITDVAFQNISIAPATGPVPFAPSTVLPEQIDAYPEITMFGPNLPAQAFFGRHIDRVTVSGLDIGTEVGDSRPAIGCEDGSDIHFSRCRVEGPCAGRSGSAKFGSPGKPAELSSSGSLAKAAAGRGARKHGHCGFAKWIEQCGRACQICSFCRESFGNLALTQAPRNVLERPSGSRRVVWPFE